MNARLNMCQESVKHASTMSSKATIPATFLNTVSGQAEWCFRKTKYLFEF